MQKVLFINACVRDHSRTLELARYFLRAYTRINEGRIRIEELELASMRLECLDRSRLEQRDEYLRLKAFQHPDFQLAHQFAKADRIIVAAPFWDLNFPAILKVYLENISVSGITFGYTQTGNVGLCNAKKLLYITTRGGRYDQAPLCDLEMGSRCMQALCALYGIESYDCLCAQGLDIVGEDVRAILDEAKTQAEWIAKTF